MRRKMIKTMARRATGMQMDIERTTPTDLADFAGFCLWADEQLRCARFCAKLWPDMRTETPNWHFPGTFYHIIHNRYNTMFRGAFLQLIASTPALRQQILDALVDEYARQRGAPVGVCWEVLGHVGDKGGRFVADNAALRKFVASDEADRRTASDEAAARVREERVKFPCSYAF
jgi:hypothetical protein